MLRKLRVEGQTLSADGIFSSFGRSPARHLCIPGILSPYSLGTTTLTQLPICYKQSVLQKTNQLLDKI
jgi:hypothetical protein